MAPLQASKHTVTDTATELLGEGFSTSETARDRSLLLKNATGTAVVWLDKVTPVDPTGQAFPWDPAVEGPLTVDLVPGEALYARLTASDPDQVIHVLPQGG